VVLAMTNLIAHFTTPWASVATVPAAAVGLLILVRSRGLGWVELGLSREHWKSGACYALAAVAVVVSVIAIGALLPWTRPMFMNNNYATVSGALIASMIIIPLQTVIPEELAFRGVLHGALNRAWGVRGVAAAGSLLFGLWHIATSLGLTSSNVGFTRIFGGGLLGTVAGVILAVAATAVAGLSSPGYAAGRQPAGADRAALVPNDWARWRRPWCFTSQLDCTPRLRARNSRFLSLLPHEDISHQVPPWLRERS
jgi:membrane protease YdiL (CAAX protease family)